MITVIVCHFIWLGPLFGRTWRLSSSLDVAGEYFSLLERLWWILLGHVPGVSSSCCGWSLFCKQSLLSLGVTVRRLWMGSVRLTLTSQCKPGLQTVSVGCHSDSSAAFWILHPAKCQLNNRVADRSTRVPVPVPRVSCRRHYTPLHLLHTLVSILSSNTMSSLLLARKLVQRTL